MKRHRTIERWALALPCFVIALGWSGTSVAAPPEEDDGFRFEDESEDAAPEEGAPEEGAPEEGEGEEEEEFIIAPVAAPEAGEGEDAPGEEDGELSEDSGFVFEDISEDQEALDAELKSGEVQAEGKVGTVTGVVLNAKQEPLAGAYVAAVGTDYVARTGVDGRYELKLPPGAYTLRAELDLYKAVEVAGVNVAEGKVGSADLELVPMAGVMETFEVSDDLNLEAEGALQEARKQKTSVNDGIDATEIGKSGGGKASSVAVRIVGATVVKRRYLFIRGLGHRYGNTLLDGARVPSPEPELRTVPLDMMPSGALSAIDIQKTFTPDVPGDFTGGSTQFVTREAPDDPTISIGINVGVNSNTTFRPMLVDAGYDGWDLIGLGNIPRGIPKSFPVEPIGRGAVDENFDPRWTEDEIEAQGEALDTRTKLHKVIAPVNFGVKFTAGNSWVTNDNGGKFGIIFSGGYDNEYQNNIESYGQFSRAESQASGKSRQVRLESYRTTYKVSYNSLLKLQLDANTNNRFALTGLYTREAYDEARDMYGTANTVSGGQAINYTRQRYTARSIAFTQLSGSHKIPRAANMLIEYFGSFSQARLDDPSLREMVFLYNDVEDYYKIDQSNGPTGNQLFLDLVDNTENGALDVTVPFRQWRGLDTRIKAGAWVDAKQRNFVARRFEYNYVTGLALPEGRDNPINDDTIGGGVGAGNGGTGVFTLVDRLREQDSYRAFSRNVSGYLMMDLPFVNWFKVSGGTRLESNIIAVTPYDLYDPDNASDLGSSRLVELDWLPAASLIFSPQLPDKGGDMNIRLGATRTVARPEFRELAPFQFRDYVGGFSKQGYSELVSTKIWNADLRIEWFPRKAEVVAISGFFKQFTDPIEEVIGASDNPTASWANVKGAYNGGFELEFRKALDFMAPKSQKQARDILRDFSVGANFAYIYSRVEIGPPCHLPGESPMLSGSIPLENCRPEYNKSTNSVRPLQGQSPWIINAYVDYENDDIGTSVRVMYNAFGPYITQVMGFGLPDIYQRPMHMVDLIASQRLLAFKRNQWGDLRNELLLTFEVENMLNAVEMRAMIDPITDTSTRTYRTRDGIDIKLGLTWKY
jgi:hypothetical protein